MSIVGRQVREGKGERIMRKGSLLFGNSDLLRAIKLS